ncbi:MAG: PH domain-containing protein, partial [Rhodanobacteraceae bacterium]|nr:PH domain-containing protein [Rhodanobacteraceae bacterium]
MNQHVVSQDTRRLPRRALLRIAADVLRENWAVLFGGAWGSSWQAEKYWRTDITPWLFGVFFITLLLAIAFWRWWYLRFALRDDVLYVRKGRWNVQEVILPWARVQGLQLTQPVVSRLLGLHDVNVESAGAEKAAVQLPGMDAALLRQLRARSQQQPGVSAEDGPAPADATELLYRLSTKQVLGVALTSWRTLLAAPVLYWFADRMDIGDQLMRWLAPAETWVKAHLQSLGGQLTLALASALLTLLGLLLAAMVWGVWRYHDFRLFRRRSGGREEWLQQSGLVARYAQTLPIARIAALTWTQNPLMRVLGRGELHCAAIGDADEENGLEKNRNSSFRLPWRSEREWLTLRNALYPLALRAKASRYQALHPYYLQHNRKYFIAPPVLVMLAVSALPFWPAWPFWLIAAGYGGLAEWQSRRRYRHWRFALSAECLRVQWGCWSRTQMFIPWNAVQRAIYEQSPGARRRGVASLSLVLPFATLKLPALLLSDAQDLFNYVSAKTLAPAA